MTNYELDEQHENEHQHPDLETTLEALREGQETETVPATVFYGLSGLQATDIAALSAVWDNLDPDYRRRVVSELAEAAETNFDLDYDVLARFAIDDEDDDVREAAIDLLWENDSLEIMDRLIAMAANDVAIPVRAAATSALGYFILQGELDELPKSETARAENAALRLLDDSEVDVRRRALEAIANSSHEAVTDAIHSAYVSDEHKMQVSALFAMGRSCDDTWGDEVIDALQSRDPEIAYEAARAAGELMLEDAVKYLRKLVFEDDREIKEVAIWSLGEIGGSEATTILERLGKDAENSGDEELLEAIEDALGNAALGSGQLYMMKFDE